MMNRNKDFVLEKKMKLELHEPEAGKRQYTF